MKGIRQERLEKYFEAEIGGAQAPLHISLISGGHSNLTYLVEDALGTKRVLRRPPTGAVLATAHDMVRKHRILAALVDSKLPVRRPLALCEELKHWKTQWEKSKTRELELMDEAHQELEARMPGQRGAANRAWRLPNGKFPQQRRRRPGRGSAGLGVMHPWRSAPRASSGRPAPLG